MNQTHRPEHPAETSPSPRWRRLAWAAPIAAAVLLLGCASSSGSSRGAAVPRIQRIVYLLQPLDSFTVQAPEGGAQALSLDSDGNIVLPGDGLTLKLLGKTTAEARALVEAKWKGARVLKFDQFRGERISVLGEVQRPANLPLSDTPMSLMDALASAGGFTSLANTRIVTVLRQNADVVQIFKIDVSAIMLGRNVEQNIPLEAGDVVTVARAFL